MFKPITWKRKPISNFVTHTVQCNRKFVCFHSIGSLWFFSVFQLAAAITVVLFQWNLIKIPSAFPEASQWVAIKLLKCDWLIVLSKPINLGWESSPHQSGKGRKKANHEEKTSLSQSKLVHMGKNCALGLEYNRQPSDSSHMQDLWHSFIPYKLHSQ